MITAERNLITLFKNYYKLGIPNFIGNSAHALFTGLLYKFNEMGFPDSLKISIREVLLLSGIADIRTLRKARDTLTNYLQNESDTDSHIAIYTEGETKDYGNYSINYVILQDNYSNIPVKKSKLYEDRQNEKGDLCTQPAKNVLHSDTILENTIQDYSSSPLNGTDPIKENSKNEKDDNEISAIAEEVAEKRAELSDEVYAIQKRLIEKFSIPDWQKPPSFQFIKSLVIKHKKDGGAEYVKSKVEQLKFPMEIKDISDKLRAYCEHPEIKEKKKVDYGTPPGFEDHLKRQQEFEKDYNPEKVKEILENVFEKYKFE